MNVRSIRFVGVALTFSICLTALAQSVDDWRNAASKTGVDSIPYSDLQEDAEDAQKIVDANRVEDLKCDDFKTGSARGYIDGANHKLVELAIAERAGEAESKKLQSQMDDLKAQLAKLEEASKARQAEMDRERANLAENEKKLASNIKEIDLRIPKLKEVIKAREDVQKAFQAAIDRAERESDPEKEPFAKQLIEHWKSGRSGHDKQIEQYKTMLANAERFREGN